MKKCIKRLLVIFILIMSYIIINLICGNKAFAVNQTVSTDINSIDSNQYPQIKEMLQTLKKQHPNWNFKILYTDIEWSDAIANEYVGHGGSPRNLVPANNSNYDGDWICKVCGANKTYDSGNWHCASESAIAYMIDPRNSTNYSDIFQFMQLSYSDCNVQTIRTMVAGTFLNNESYINAIVEAAKKYNVNAYYIVARILQEQGKSGSTLSSGNGYKGQYVGYYNVFNIGASGSGQENVILNGLKKAQSYGWTSMEKSIMGGTEIIAQRYISRGQDTLYFQKFDVENSDGNLYWHQYMQNILAAQKEGQTLRKTFESVGSTEAAYTFIIPLYKNMPSSASSRPSTTSSPSTPTTTDLVKVNVTNSLYLRSEPKKSATTVGSVYKNEIVTRLIKATDKVDGTYWDYVMKSDGTKGYAARQTYDSESTYKLYLVPVNQETPTTPEQPNDGGNNAGKVKVDNNSRKITITPEATIDDIKATIGNEISIKNAKGEIVSINSNLATGYTINDTYIIVKKGDANADGVTNTFDYIRIMNYIMGNKTMTDEEKLAADANSDGVVNTFDYIRIMNYILGNKNIEL